MTKKQKLVMKYLCDRCQQKRTYLVSPQDITKALCKKYVLSTSEIDEIMAELAKLNYIEYVVSQSKENFYYCVNLKKSGQSFNADSRRTKQTFALLVLRSIFLATVSFVFGLILRAIFKS